MSPSRPWSVNPETEELEPVLISAIEHWSYCPRQCGLIHVEQVFDENLFTLRGRQAHERAHEPDATVTAGARVERALPLWSEALGLSGTADVVEFHADGEIVPVEYKHGPRRARRHDDLQLCAQALCLEEMFGRPVPRGCVYYHSTRRRREVLFDGELRRETAEAVAAIRTMRREGRLPPPVDDARCPNCSLIDACAPSMITAALARDARRLFRPTASEGLA